MRKGADMAILRGGFIEYLLERSDVRGPWKEHTEHDFVKQLANNTLDIERFKFYLIQDYLFLVSKGLPSAAWCVLTTPDPVFKSICPIGLQE